MIAVSASSGLTAPAVRQNPRTPGVPKRVRVLFDEAHSEAWTIRPELARSMQPSHPRDSSYALAAETLAACDFEVAANVEERLSAERLEDVDVLVIPHPSDPAWERTTGVGSPCFSPAELADIARFVRSGGGLIILGETENEKYGNNLNELLAPYALRLENETVQDYAHHHGSAPSWVLGELDGGSRGRGGDLLARVAVVCFYRATTILAPDHATVPVRTGAFATNPGAPLMAAVEHGDGRVVVLADSDLFGDDCIEELDHLELWRNVVYWAGARAFTTDDGRGRPWAARERPPARDRASAADAAWRQLREACDALGLLQSEDGSIDPGVPGVERAPGHVQAIASAVARLSPRFPHQERYLEAVLGDLEAWEAAGFARPDFTRALAELRPERQREDGIEHLVVMPMYKQNASRATCFEALIVRVPWPAWVAELERTRYQNPKFVPVELVAYTRGYESECAVLFPEMVSVRDRPVNNFGAIFCDREAGRFRRVAAAAADLLGLNLPPDAAALLSSPSMAQDAFILWDLIHDRNHSHGELPFDPFMIRQRAPYWMYALEELRCDLIAFAEAARLEREGFAFARHVQYAILFDRLLRFPITGARVRNYDGLGGQLLFAHLHRHGHVHWTDNQLTIEWESVADGVAALRQDVLDLYRAGIDRSKLTHWIAGHDLVAASVTPAAGSRWAARTRRLEETEDPRGYLDLVLEDEFPLSIFYSSLKAKLAGAG
ncbi:MAG TPA: DUF6421 family protein [Solirubrobacteraceae bacterium]|nr:DUF6421 family protein [Solirubrobacteraceae bacterium]